MPDALRTKLTTYFSLFLVVSGGLLFVALDRFIQTEFENIERAEARVAITRALQVIRNDGKSLRAWARDISPWDETYEFIESADLRYVADNFPQESIKNLELDLMFFVDSSGSVVWSHMAEQRLTDSFQFQELPGIADDSADWDSSTGYVGLHRMSPDTIYLLAVHPILTSEYKGPNRGATIMGRRLDNSRFEQLIESSVANFDLQPYQPAAHQGSPTEISLANAHSIEVARANGETYAQTSLRDFNGQPVLTLRVRAHREVTSSGARATRTVMYVFAATAILGLILLQLLVARMSRNSNK